MFSLAIEYCTEDHLITARPVVSATNPSAVFYHRLPEIKESIGTSAALRLNNYKNIPIYTHNNNRLTMEKPVYPRDLKARRVYYGSKEFRDFVELAQRECVYIISIEVNMPFKLEDSACAVFQQFGHQRYMIIGINSIKIATLQQDPTERVAILAHAKVFMDAFMDRLGFPQGYKDLAYTKAMLDIPFAGTVVLQDFQMILKNKWKNAAFMKQMAEDCKQLAANWLSQTSNCKKYLQNWNECICNSFKLLVWVDIDKDVDGKYTDTSASINRLFQTLLVQQGIMLNYCTQIEEEIKSAKQSVNDTFRVNSENELILLVNANDFNLLKTSLNIMSTCKHEIESMNKMIAENLLPTGALRQEHAKILLALRQKQVKDEQDRIDSLLSDLQTKDDEKHAQEDLQKREIAYVLANQLVVYNTNAELGFQSIETSAAIARGYDAKKIKIQ